MIKKKFCARELVVRVRPSREKSRFEVDGLCPLTDVPKRML